MINGTLSPTLCLSKTAEHDQQLLSHHRKKPGNLYLIGPNTKNLTLPRQTIFRLLFILPACEAWLKSLILRRHLSFLLGVLFNFLIFHFASASLVLPFDSPPAVNAWPPHPKALLSSVWESLAQSKALGLQLQMAGFRTDKCMHPSIHPPSTHPSYHPWIHSSFHPLTLPSIYLPICVSGRPTNTSTMLGVRE